MHGAQGWPWAGRDGDGEDLVSKHIKSVSQDAVVSTNKLLSLWIAPGPSGQLAGAPNPGGHPGRRGRRGAERRGPAPIPAGRHPMGRLGAGRVVAVPSPGQA